MSVEQEHPEAYKPTLDLYIAPIGAAAERHAARSAPAELRAARLIAWNWASTAN